MKTKKTELVVKIRKTAMHRRGTEMMKALMSASGELPIPILAQKNETIGKWEFFAENIEKENGIGYLEPPVPEIFDKLDDPCVSYTCRLTAFNGNIFDAKMVVEEAEKIASVDVKENEDIASLKKRIVSEGICESGELDENIRIMRSHRCPDELIRQVLMRYRKFDKPVKQPKTVYIDPDPKSKEASIMSLALLNTLIGAAMIFEGDKSVGKNVCAETVAKLLHMPYYMITFNRGMTADDIWGTKATDNSASDALNVSLAESYMRVQNKVSCDPDDMKAAAKYEYLRAKSASVSIVQEVSTLAEWLKNGGVMCFNEMNMAEANFFASFTNQITDGSGFIDVAGYGRIKINPDCVLIGTQNADYTGVMEQNDATMSRFGCIQFPYPKSIRAQLEAVVGKQRLDAEYFKQTNDLYKVLLASVQKGMMENSCLNIRGFIRALQAVAQVPGLTSLKSQIEIHVVNTCPVDDRMTIMSQVRDKITL